MSDREFLVSATPREVADGALLTLVHQVLDRLGRLERKIDDTREDVTAIKSNRMDERVAELADRLERADARIRKLEDDLNQRKGASRLVEWLSKYAPWLLGVLGIGVGVIAEKKIL